VRRAGPQWMATSAGRAISPKISPLARTPVGRAGGAVGLTRTALNAIEKNPKPYRAMFLERARFESRGDRKYAAGHVSTLVTGPSER